MLEVIGKDFFSLISMNFNYKIYKKRDNKLH